MRPSRLREALTAFADRTARRRPSDLSLELDRGENQAPPRVPKNRSMTLIRFCQRGFPASTKVRDSILAETWRRPFGKEALKSLIRRAAPDLAIRGRRAGVPLPFHFRATRAGGFGTTTLDISRRCTGGSRECGGIRVSQAPSPRHSPLRAYARLPCPEGSECSGFDSKLVELSTRSGSAKTQTLPPARDAIHQVDEPRCGFVRRPITRGVMVGSGLREEWPAPFRPECLFDPRSVLVRRDRLTLPARATGGLSPS